MEPKGEAGGVRVYDSTPITRRRSPATWRRRAPWRATGRLVVAFQPHLVSRTRTFGQRWVMALGAADEVVVTDVYLAREAADPEVTGALVAEAVPLPPEHVAFVAELDEVAAALVSRSRPGDLVLTLGAGSITEVGPAVLDAARRCACVAFGAPAPRRAGRGQGHPAQPATVRAAGSGAGAGWRGATSLVLVLVLAIVGGGIYAVWFSKWLAVEDIEVSGAQTVETCRHPRPLRHRRGRAAGRASTWRRPSGASARWPSSGR